MPAKPFWHRRIPHALEVLASVRGEILDRNHIQVLLGVGKTEAWRIMRSLGAFGAGGASLITKAKFVEALQAVQAGAEWQYETRRIEKLQEKLAEDIRTCQARQIRIADEKARFGDYRIASLPSHVHLRAGELRIEFNDTKGLLESLYQLAQTIMDDYDGFRRVLGEL